MSFSKGGVGIYRGPAVTREDWNFIPSDTAMGFVFGSKSDSSLTHLKISSFLFAWTNISALAVPFILKDTLLLSPSQVGFLGAICGVPSLLKPIAAIYIPRRYRQKFIVGSSLGQAAMYAAIGLITVKGAAATLPLVTSCLLVHSVFRAVSVSLRDAMVVEMAAEFQSDTDAHGLFADMSLVSQIGLLPVAYLSGNLLQYITPSHLVALTAVFPAMAAVSGILLLDGQSEGHRVDSSAALTYTPSEQLTLSLSAMQDSETGFFSTTTGRSLLLSLAPSYAGAMFFYYTQGLGLSPEFLGRFQLVGAVGAVLGNSLSKLTAKLVDPRHLSNAANLLVIPTVFTLLCVTGDSAPGHVWAIAHRDTFLLSRHFLIDFLLSLTALPSVVQLMRSAPKGAEAAYVSIVGTLGDVGDVANSVVSSGSMNLFGIGSHKFGNINQFLIFCMSLNALGTPLNWFYQDDIQEKGEEVFETRVKGGDKIFELSDTRASTPLDSTPVEVTQDTLW